MEDLHERFTDCCHKLQSGKVMALLHAEIEDILKDPRCWELCITAICGSPKIQSPELVYCRFIAAKMIHVLIGRSWDHVTPQLQYTIRKV